MRIAMIGTGYVGLVSGACFSEFGHHVACVDKDMSKIDALRAGRMPIYEPGLEEVVADNVKAGRLSFTGDLAASVKAADAVFIAVGTPSRRGDGHADLTYVFAAAEEIAAALDGYTAVITKSTVPVGTGCKVEEAILRIRPNAQVDVCSNPCGTTSDNARAVLRELYRPLFLNETPMLFTSRETSELIKYAANAFLATKITFINEMADICERVGANVQDVARGIGLDGRIGAKFLHAGPGYGGSCFPKDTVALLKTAQDVGAPSRIVEAVAKVNEDRKERMAEKIVAAFGGVSGKTIAVLGLTFKPNTDDMRESPSLVILPELTKQGARVRAYDPEGMNEAKKHLQVEMCTDAYAALEGADGVVILTEWNEFRALDLKTAKRLLKRPLMVDLRNIYRPEEMAKIGFSYVSIGRAPVGM